MFSSRSSILISVLAYACALDLDGNGYRLNKNKRLIGQVLDARTITSSLRCAMFCHDLSECWSFNVVKNNGELLCELNGASPLVLALSGQ